MIITCRASPIEGFVIFTFSVRWMSYNTAHLRSNLDQLLPGEFWRIMVMDQEFAKVQLDGMLR